MFTLSIHNEQSVDVVIPNGRIDSTTNSDLDRALKPILEKENYLIIDLSECDYLSSAGIRTLLITEKKLKERKGGLFLCGLSTDVFQVLEMAGMIQIFHVTNNLDLALSEIERRRQIAGGTRKWLSGQFTFELRQIVNKRESARLWNNSGIVGYNELGFSVGIGSPAEKPAEDKQTHGIFVTTGHCAGFIPDNKNFPSDFRLPRHPDHAGIFVSSAISFGKQPSVLVRLQEPKSLLINQLIDGLNPVICELKSDKHDLAALVIANLDPGNPSVALCLMVDRDPGEVLKPTGFPELVRCGFCDENGVWMLGAKFLLNELPKIPEDNSLTAFIEKILTFENIVDIEVLNPDDEFVNPFSWLFVSEGVEDSSQKRLQIETEDDLHLDPHKVFLARRLYTDSGRLVIKQIHGGYSAQTFQVTSFDQKGRRLRPTVLKIADRSMISRESDRCRRYANPYILNNSAMVLGTEYFGNTGALRYNFVGIGGEQTRLKWLTHYFNSWTIEQLEPLFDKIFLQILHPWYGQPIREKIYPFRDHDPTFTFFPQLCETAHNQLLISPDEQFFTIRETGQRLTNPYWFLKHEFARRRENPLEYYTSICHGDLNMQNILLDDDLNVYLIDFSETRPRSVISDFARLEAIFMIEHAPLGSEVEIDQYFRFISHFYGSVHMDTPPLNSYTGEHLNMVNRNVALTLKMREYAFKGVKGDPDSVPYCIALLEWVLPIVCYSSTDIAHQRLSMIVAGLLCEQIINQPNG